MLRLIKTLQWRVSTVNTLSLQKLLTVSIKLMNLLTVHLADKLRFIMQKQVTVAVKKLEAEVQMKVSVVKFTST